MNQVTWTAIATLLFCLFLRGGADLLDNCETKQIEMTIVRRLSVHYGGRARNVVCEAVVQVTECDGTCVSRVTPSVSRFPGFDKICKCCSESHLITRTVTLTSCRDGNQVLENVHHPTTYSEPAGCACRPCQN